MEYPQRISSFVTEAVGDGLAVLAGGQKYVLNATSALVFQHCDGQTSPERLTEILRQKFNLVPAEAEHLTQLALEELESAQLLQPAALPPAAMFSRRQALGKLATLGLSLAILPLVERVAEANEHGEGTELVPLLECVDNNGDGTYTAHFGYLNATHRVIVVPIGPWNTFVGRPWYRGQPIVFYPGEHLSVFTVVFNAADTLKWKLKALGGHEHQVEASATSESCSTTLPTTTEGPY